MKLPLCWPAASRPSQACKPLALATALLTSMAALLAGSAHAQTSATASTSAAADSGNANANANVNADVPRSVALAGVRGTRALWVVNGAPPKAVAVGASHHNVQVINVRADEADVRIGGQTRTLRIGESPLSVAGSARPTSNTGRIVLLANPQGHFLSPGLINGKSTRFLVDTGATMVSLGMGEASKLGIDYSKGRPVRIGTANGVAQGWQLKLASVSIADVELRNVDAIINSSDMPYVLLGNSYLNSFHMSRIGSQLTLDRAK